MRTEEFENAVLYFGDCEEILPDMAWKFDALVTDPPYEFNTSGGGTFRKARPYLDEIANQDLDKGFNMNLIINPFWFQSVVIFCCNNQLDKILPRIGGLYDRFAVCFWEKTNPMPVGNKNYVPNIEPYIHAWNKGAHPLGTIEQKHRTFRSTNGKSKFDHPTVKPVALMEKIMRNVNGEKIIDPYMGTASTGIACLKQEKHFTGIEKNQKYFDIACKRIENIEYELKKIYPPNVCIDSLEESSHE